MPHELSLPDGISEAEPLARNRAFRIFWAGQSVAMLCGSVAFIAVPLLVLDITGSVMQLGAVTAVAALSQLLALTFGGGLVDRYRMKLMVACELARAALLGLLVAALAMRWMQMPILYGVVAVTSALGALFSVAYQTVVKDMVRPSDFLAANARLNISVGISNVVGPAVGGVVLETIGASAALTTLVLANLLSAASLVFVRDRRPWAMAGSKRAGLGLFSLGKGIRQIVSDPVLRATVPFTAVAVLLSAATVDLLIFHLKHKLNAADASVGTVLSVSSIGFIVAAVTCQKIRQRWGLAATALTALCVQGAVLMSILYANSLALLMAGGVAFVFGDTLRVIVVGTAEQERAPSELLGRVVAAKGLLLGLVAPVALSLDTAAAAHWGPQVVLSVNGAVALGLGLLGLLYRLLRPRAALP